MSHFAAARNYLVLALFAVLILPETSSAGPFRRRCRHRQPCPQPTSSTVKTQAMATSACQSGAICVTRLSAKYMDATGKCVYAIYDATRCPSGTTSHYDTKCDWSCPKYCTTSPCACINRSAVTTVSRDEYSSREKSYTATIELLKNGLTAQVESEEYPNSKKVSEYVIELEKNKLVRIVWLKLSEGRYAGAGHQVGNSTPLTPQEIAHKSTRIKLSDGTATKAFLVEVASINGVNVDRDHVVLVDF